MVFVCEGRADKSDRTDRTNGDGRVRKRRNICFGKEIEALTRAARWDSVALPSVLKRNRVEFD
jgi:hypothetical protein